MLHANFPAIQILLPLISALVCGVLPWKEGRLAWLLCNLATLATLMVSVGLAYDVFYANPIHYPMGNWEAPFGIEYRVDAFNAVVLLLLSGIGLLVSFYSYPTVMEEIERGKQPLFYATYLLCLCGLLGMAITNDVFNIYVFLEISSLATYALIGMGRDRQALLAAFEYLILGTIGATFILIAIGLLYMMTGTLNISDLSIRVVPVIDTAPVKAALAFFIVGLALKIAIFPLHLWLANAYTFSPSMVSAFLSATATKVSIYVLARVVFIVFGAGVVMDTLSMKNMLITLSLFAIVVGSLVAVFQDNIKRMLAYSSVAQIGYMILAISLSSPTALAALLLHMVAHGLAKASLFMAVGGVALRVGDVRLEHFAGIGRKMPFTMAAFVISGLSLVGVPMTAGFISKWFLLSALVEAGLWPVLLVVLASSLLALVYIWRVVEVAYFRQAPGVETLVHEAPPVMIVALWAATLLTIFFGVHTSPLVDYAMRMGKYLVGM